MDIVNPVAVARPQVGPVRANGASVSGVSSVAVIVAQPVGQAVGPVNAGRQRGGAAVGHLQLIGLFTLGDGLGLGLDLVGNLDGQRVLAAVLRIVIPPDSGAASVTGGAILYEPGTDFSGADALEYEQAARVRDLIQSIEATLERQRVIDTRLADRDLWGLHREGPRGAMAILPVREGVMGEPRANLLTGMVVDPRGQPVIDGSVRVETAGWSGGELVCRTDDRGRFRTPRISELDDATLRWASL